MVEIKEVSYKTFGKCVQISNGCASVYITTDIGPRIINYSLDGCENMMFENESRSISNDGEDFDLYYGKGSAWYIYGGHRLWTSPEARPRSYYPDNEPVKYEKIENGIRLLCNEQKRNMYKYTIEVTMDESSSDVRVVHKITNTGAFDAEFAAWALSVTDTGGMAAVPVPTRETGLLANRAIALWPYAKMTDKRVYWGDRFITLTQDKNVKEAFKLGINNEDGYVLVFNHDCLFIKKYDHIMGEKYPDGGMSFETYTNEHFLEAETLSPLYSVKPGETIEHIENWSLFKDVKRPAANDEKAISEISNKYVGK